MAWYEYEAKDLFAAHGVPVSPGIVAVTPDEAASAAEMFGQAVVVKAQVKTGGRAKAGGVTPAASRACFLARAVPEEPETIAPA